MLVSNFKVDTRYSEGAWTRKTIYVLQVTNLENVPIRFLVECFSSTNEPLALSLALPASTSPGPPVSQGSGSVSAMQEIAPRESRSFILSGASCQGYVSLRVPPLWRGAVAGKKGGVQVDHPVQTLLHASREDFRGAYFAYPWKDGTAATLDWMMKIGDDFSSEAVAISTGKAENLIEAEGSTIKGVKTFFDNLKQGKLKAEKMAGAAVLPEEERVAVLVDLLLGLPATKSELDVLNKFLAEHGSQVTVKTR